MDVNSQPKGPEGEFSMSEGVYKSNTKTARDFIDGLSTKKEFAGGVDESHFDKNINRILRDVNKDQCEFIYLMILDHQTRIQKTKMGKTALPYGGRNFHKKEGYTVKLESIPLDLKMKIYNYINV